jgi:hypothetical protein
MTEREKRYDKSRKWLIVCSDIEALPPAPPRKRERRITVTGPLFACPTSRRTFMAGEFPKSESSPTGRPSPRGGRRE